MPRSSTCTRQCRAGRMQDSVHKEIILAACVSSMPRRKVTTVLQLSMLSMRRRPQCQSKRKRT